MRKDRRGVAKQRRPRYWRGGLVAGLLLLAAAALAGAEIVDLPRPNLELIEEGVAVQLESRRAAVEAVFAAPGASAAERAEAIGSLGGLYYLYDYIDLARRCFATAAGLAPQEARWPYLTGLTARLDGDLAAAAAAFATALELEPDNPTTHVRLADALLALGRSQDAAASYGAALRLDPNRPAAHYGLGRLAAEDGDHQRAIEHFEQALALQPEATSLQHQIGMAYRALGDRETAARRLALNTGGRVRVVDPTVESLGREIQATTKWFSAGAQAMRSGDFDQAIELFAKAAEERPDDHLVDYNLALAYLRTDRRPEAITALERAIAKQPDFRNGHYNLGLLLAEDGRLEDAEGAFRRAHEVDPEDQAAHLEWATALAQLGRSAEAESELGRLLERSPALPAARLRLAQLQLSRDALTDAAENFRRVLVGDADAQESAAAHLGLGQLAEKRREAAAAVEHYRAAVAVSDELAPRLALAGALGRLGRFDAAADAFTSAIATGEAPVEAHFGRAMALLLAGADRRARTALEESLEAHPESLPLRHLLSRLLAASTDSAVRDGARALALARQVFAAQQNLSHAETVAMALAETGDFAAAVDWQRRVVGEVERSGRAQAVAGAQRRLAGYERGEPCRAPWKGG